MIEKFSNQTVW